LYHQEILAPTLALAEVYFQQYAAAQGRSAADASLMLRAISGMVLGLVLQRIMGDPLLEAEWDALPALLTDLILKGIESEQV